MKNFWQQFNKPILAMAPMAGITDSPFRQMCQRFGADILYSEMASATALTYAPEKTVDLSRFDEIERPYVVQLFGSNPDHFEIAVRIISEQIKPDGFDINFGCPVPKVAKQGAGAALFPDLKLSREIIARTIGSTDLPVSIKTRAAVRDIDVLNFLDYMAGLDIKAIMIHGRTLAQGFAGQIDCAIIKKARDYFGGIILANGGIGDAAEAECVLRETIADGLGIGRGALGRPWVFEEIRESLAFNAGTKVPNCPPLRRGRTAQDVFMVALEHGRLAHSFRGRQGIIEMRKHLCWYVQGLPNARRWREELVKVESLEEIERICARP